MADNLDPWQKKFTPGPWQVMRDRGSCVIAPEQPRLPDIGDRKFYQYPYIVVQAGLHVSTDLEAQYANARLIAAAPDLLAVCEYALSEAERGNYVPHHLIDMAQDAVNKAYGYQPTPTAVWWNEWRGG